MYELSCVLLLYRACTVCVVLISFLSICKAVRVVESSKKPGCYYVSIACRSSHTGVKKKLGRNPSTDLYYPIGSTFGDACGKAGVKSSSRESKTKAKDVAAAIRGKPTLMNQATTMVLETDPPEMKINLSGVHKDALLICTSQYPISPIASLLMIDEDDDLVSRK